jgi:hypothetical protein
VTTEQKASSPSPAGPSVTFASCGGLLVSSLVSSVYVRLRSLVFGLMRRCRSRTLTVFGGLLSRLLKIGRSGLLRYETSRITEAINFIIALIVILNSKQVFCSRQ